MVRLRMGGVWEIMEGESELSESEGDDEVELIVGCDRRW